MTRIERQIAYRMVEGLPRPLTLMEAAKAEGYRLRAARGPGPRGPAPAFNLYRAQLLKGAARELRPRGTCARRSRYGTTTGMEKRQCSRTVRLKACQFIEGKPDGASVVVNVSQTSNVISPGYVIRLPAKAGDALPAIEHEPLTTRGEPLKERRPASRPFFVAYAARAAVFRDPRQPRKPRRRRSRSPSSPKSRGSGTADAPPGGSPPGVPIGSAGALSATPTGNPIGSRGSMVATTGSIIGGGRPGG